MAAGCSIRLRFYDDLVFSNSSNSLTLNDSLIFQDFILLALGRSYILHDTILLYKLVAGSMMVFMDNRYPIFRVRSYLLTECNPCGF